MTILFRLFCITITFFSFLIAQEDEAFDALQKIETARYASSLRSSYKMLAAPQPVDMKYYKLNLRIADQLGFLRGDVSALGIVRDSISSITYDLDFELTVDSAFIGSIPTQTQRNGSTVTIMLPETYHQLDTVKTQLFYHGTPRYTGLGSYSDVVRSDGTRWTYTLSEPYGSRDWWPCIDHPNDKADSVDIIVTCGDQNTAASNGRLTDTLTLGDGTKRFTWKHRYPVSTYLIAITIGKFNTFSDWFKYSPTDSMEVINYVLPDLGLTNPSYRTYAGYTVSMLDTFTTIFGPYPFIKEKYGHVQFGWGGGMEHQTLTSLGASGFNEGTIAHELVHQWFGDLITCRTWSDLWLNEGFAQYFEAVWREKKYGIASYASRMASRLTSAKTATGTLFVKDTANVNNLFASSRVYNKGASVLHMLRHVLGDSIFFAAIKAYANDPKLMYGTAATANFQYWCETVSGRDLDWFFNQWIFGEKYPKYTYSHSSQTTAGGSISTVRISQLTGTTNPTFFIMPIDLKFSATGWDTTVTVFNDSAVQLFTIPLSHVPSTISLDPNQWILRDVTFNPVGITVPEQSRTPLQFALMQNYPNPFNPVTRIAYSVPANESAGRVRHTLIKVYDMLGREVATLVDEMKAPGSYEVQFDAGALAEGVYYYTLVTEGYTAVRKMVLCK